ncbi:Calcium-dependent lipid-binding (CaLB domain) family protein [Trifolium repens]|nr:Calcium-dependent lipid-binding (CaLB domain) family protein [Trifolium repens]
MEKIPDIKRNMEYFLHLFSILPESSGKSSVLGSIVGKDFLPRGSDINSENGTYNTYGMKVFETNEKKLVMELVIKWAGNPNIVLSLHVLSMKIKVQVR